MSVVSRDARRRWSLVGIGVLVLCLVPVAAAWRPVPAVASDAARLRALILGSAARPYQGYAVSDGAAGLPDLPELSDVSGLLGGTTSVRAWYASTAAWRVAAVAPTGERDVYRTPDGTYTWDFERNQLGVLVGEPPVRLPWAADVLPPDLARRILDGAAPGDPVTPLPARRIAGVVAAGLRLTPSDPDTTIGRVDVWADPRTGLPLRVELAARASATAVFTTRFLDLDQRAPDPAVLVPVLSEASSFTTASAGELLSTINANIRGRLPARLAGHDRFVFTGVTAVAAYGTGLAGFVVVPVPGRLGPRLLQAARNGGGQVELPGTGAEAYELRTSVVTTLVAHGAGRFARRTYLLAGLVQPELLERAATELLGGAR